VLIVPLNPNQSIVGHTSVSRQQHWSPR